MALYNYPAYPNGLPNFWAGSNQDIEANLIDSDGSMGLPVQRQVRSLHPRLVTCRWRMTRSQYSTFKNWWKTTLLGGVVPWTGNFTLNGETGAFNLQFISDPSYDSLKGGDWNVSAKAWCWKSPEMTRDEAFEQVIDKAFVESLAIGVELALDSYYDLGNQP